jgi:hypothetical protein
MVDASSSAGIAGLADFGYHNGQNVHVEFRFPPDITGSSLPAYGDAHRDFTDGQHLKYIDPDMIGT